MRGGRACHIKRCALILHGRTLPHGQRVSPGSFPVRSNGEGGVWKDGRHVVRKVARVHKMFENGEHPDEGCHSARTSSAHGLAAPSVARRRPASHASRVAGSALFTRASIVSLHISIVQCSLNAQYLITHLSLRQHPLKPCSLRARASPMREPWVADDTMPFDPYALEMARTVARFVSAPSSRSRS